jgi:HSP20 family protein
VSNLTLEGGSLTISGERKSESTRKEGRYHRVERSHGKFFRTFTLPAIVDPNIVEAKYENGVLRVSMAKKPDARARQIKVNDSKRQLTSKAA